MDEADDGGRKESDGGNLDHCLRRHRVEPEPDRTEHVLNFRLAVDEPAGSK
jgi:hypothetical protein